MGAALLNNRQECVMKMPDGICSIHDGLLDFGNHFRRDVVGEGPRYRVIRRRYTRKPDDCGFVFRTLTFAALF